MNTSVRTTSTATKKQPMDVYKEVTRRIVLRLAEGDIPWRKPWNAPFSADIINYKTRKPYNGINRFILSQPGEYMTFNQCREKGGTIVRGEKGHLIVKYGFFVPKENKEMAERLKKEGKDISHLEIPYLKHDWVFHISQTEGVKTLCESAETKSAQNPTDMADFIIGDFRSRKGTQVKEAQTDSCSYDIQSGTITVPHRSQFLTEEEWYGAVFSQMMRAELSRRRGTEEPSKTAVIKDELTVEIGASMMLNAVGLTRREAEDNTQAKCQEWIREMNRDARLIINASSQAEKIAKDILSPLFLEEEYSE